MNYEQLLDEIMVNTVSAQELIWLPQRDLRYGVCPGVLEFHTSLFLASALLAFDQHKPIIFLVQVEELPHDAMVYTGQIWPHFGRVWNQNSEDLSAVRKLQLEETDQNFYTYLDKLFAYLAVINMHQEHVVIFVKTGAKICSLLEHIKPLLEQWYSLMVMNDCYAGLSMESCKEKTAQLIASCKHQSMTEKQQYDYPALACLSSLLAQRQGNQEIEHLINTGDLGLDEERSTSLWFMIV